MYLVLIAALIAGFYVGWNIGSNDAANAMGVPVGGRIISYRRAVTIMILFVILGAVLEGWKVMETVGQGIVVSPEVGNPLVEMPEIAVIALFSAGIWVSAATFLKLPVSTSQAIVGSIIGSGVLLSFLNPVSAPSTSVEFGVLSEIGLAWVLTPVAAAVFAYVIYHAVGPLLRRIGSVTTLNRILGILVISAGAFAAYSLGANNVGAATALVSVVVESGSAEIFWTPKMIGLFGGIALSVGVVTYSRGVMKTIGSGITNLGPTTAFAAQFAAAITVWVFTQIGAPVSTSQAIVGGVAGVGLVKGTATISKGRLGKIGLAWVLTPSVSAVLTFIFGWMIIGG
ncbi:hypothetical protein AKJ50_00685 [candidate division MSBL1 archaeon SCGC-AAA382A13]|uniref:Phosphate permease n=2 Tax=candidate division MSBL1 TaxID=215777 RepID=A0A133VGE7_9EURY|nr:hypothetical protein AKJ50_00685 [candidate division MSBL1 archaeon SCGC-AAA382A13]